MLLIWIIRDHSKTNRFSTVKRFAFTRHANPICCPVGALGLHLLKFLHHPQNSTIEWTNYSSWDNLHIFPSPKTRSQPISWTPHANAIRDAQSDAGLVCRKLTHESRNASARHQEQQGVSSNQIGRHGDWRQGPQEDVYTNQFPMDSIRALAGMAPERGSYFLPRSCLVPPNRLQQKLFPWCEAILNLSPNLNLTTHGFLRTLQRLRVAILQDSCYLIDMYPSLPVFTFPVFHSTEFKSFKTSLLEAAGSQENTVENWKEQTDPAVFAVLDHVLMNQQIIMNRQRMQSDSSSSASTESTETGQKHVMYSMPSISTMGSVAVVMKEWKTILKMDQEHGTSWRSKSRDRTEHGRRKKIVDAVKKKMDQGIPEVSAIAQVEYLRDREGDKKPYSLYHLCEKVLKKHTSEEE